LQKVRMYDTDWSKHFITDTDGLRQTGLEIGT